MAESYSSFQDWLNKNQGQVSSGGRFNPAPAPEFEGKSPSPPDPLTWLFDMISRPLFGVTNAANASVDRQVEAAKKYSEGDFWGGAGETLGQIGQALIPTDFFTGMFSDEKKYKRYSGESMEHITDKIGELNPDYKDEQDNVNPWVKGIGGLALDIVADPLTWIPGAAIVSGAKGINNLSKGLVHAGGAEGDAARAAEREAAKAARNQKATAQRAQAEGLSVDEFLTKNPQYASRMDDFDIAMSNKISDKLDDVTAATTGKGKRAAKRATETLIKNSEKANAARKMSSTDTFVEEGIPDNIAEELLKGFSKENIAAMRKSTAEEALKAKDAKAPVQSLAEQLAASPRREPIRKFFEKVEELTKASPKKTRLPAPLKLNEWAYELAEKAPGFTLKAKVGSKELKIPVGEAQEYIKNPAVSAPYRNAVAEALKAHHQSYISDFKEALSRRMRLDAIGEETPITPASTAETATVFSTFNKVLEENEAAVEQAIGSQLTTYLRSKKSPLRFAEAMDILKKALVGEADLDVLMARADSDSSKAAVSALLRSIGIDVKGTLAAREGVESVEQTAQMVAAARGGVSGEAVDAAKAFKEVFDGEIIDIPERFPFRTEEGVFRDEEIVGAGKGRRERELNMFSIYTRNRAFMSVVRERMGKLSNHGGASYSQAMRAAVMPIMRASDMFAAAEGIPMYIGLGTDKRMLYWTQLVDIMTAHAPEASNRMFWNFGTLVPETSLMQAVLLQSRGASDDVLREMLLNDRKFGEKGLLEETFKNPTKEGGVFGHSIQKPKKSFGKGVKVVKQKNGWGIVYSSERLVDDLMDALKASKDELEEVMLKNEQIFRQRVVAETGAMTDATLKDLDAILADPQRIAEGLQKYSDLPVTVKNYADEFHATGDAQKATTVLVEGLVDAPKVANAKGAKATVNATTNAAKKSAKNPKKKPEEVFEDANKAGRAPAEKAARNAMKEDENVTRQMAAESDLPEELLDLSGRELSYGGVSANRWRMLDPLQKIFNAKFGVKDLWNLNHALGNSNMVYIGKVSAALNSIAKKYDRPTLTAAFKVLQNGSKNADPVLREAADEMGRLMDNLWSADNDLLGNQFFRNNYSMNVMNEMLASMNIDHLFDIDRAVNAAKINGTDAIQEAATQWRSFDIGDPLDYMHKMYVASHKLATNQAVADSFLKEATKLGWTSKVMKPGYVKFTSTGDSTFMRHLPQDIFVDKRIAEQMHHLDVSSRTSVSLNGEIGKFIHNVFDPIQNAWKYAITLPRPGHHIRNLIGDSSLTFVAEGMEGFMFSSKAAFKVLATKNNYEGIDIAKSLRAFGEYEVPGLGDVILKGKRYGDYTADDLYKIANEAGLMPTYRVNEDFLLEDVAAQNRVTKIADAITLRHGRIENFVGGISEYRDHYSRLQHMLQFMYKAEKHGGYKTREEMINAAAIQVKKFHPDANMLSKAEAKYMRRVIPFYTWFRGVLPAIVETTVTQAGRVSVFPKASYNLAVAMGVNPDSMADPFPTDQLFPSFLTENALGPVFGNAQDGYFGINPGIAHLDVFNMLGPDPMRGILGSSSPLMRVPFEMMAGSSLGTGARIKDNSDYLDSTLPGINYISNITGTSVTGSLVSLLQGRGFDPQYQVAAGNKSGVDSGASLFNYLTGLGLQNMSRPNYINYAEIEKRNKAGKDNRNGF